MTKSFLALCSALLVASAGCAEEVYDDTAPGAEAATTDQLEAVSFGDELDEAVAPDDTADQKLAPGPSCNGGKVCFKYPGIYAECTVQPFPGLPTSCGCPTGHTMISGGSCTLVP
ncbi:MAG: hypothetical protein KBG48_09760 [Kofleriaceae bacterium]|jgi:hypothetical protein|nr:hypothetical protein [Kofleriaceae bacterium]MBP9167663.1 hypothetical protein [Kofleriaceae bacterium]MBP9862000.1 hypothetical protein [Kofleriaceae bacterium]